MKGFLLDPFRGKFYLSQVKHIDEGIPTGMTDVVTTRTPFRVSFFGGGTDFPEWYTKYGGATLSTSIDKYCYISCLPFYRFYEHKYRVVWSKIEEAEYVGDIQHPVVREVLRHYSDIQNIEIHYSGDLPARAGLGSSSAFTVGLIHALEGLQKNKISRSELARKAIHFERHVLSEVVGYQDQLAAAHGGFNHITYDTDGTCEVSSVNISSERKALLEDHLLMFFTGIKRISSEIASEVVGGLHEQKNLLFHMQALVDEGLDVLQSQSDIREFGTLLHESWQLKRHLAKSVSNKTIDDIYSRGCGAGAIGGKILGAGGGGFLLFFVEPHKKAAVREALSEFKAVEFKFEEEGTRLIRASESHLPHGLQLFQEQVTHQG